MKTLIFLTLCGLAAVSFAFPPLLPIARSTTDPRRDDPTLRREAIRILTEQYAIPPEANGVDERQDLLLWLTDKPEVSGKELTPLLFTVLNVEPSENVRLIAIKTLGMVPSSPEVIQALRKHLNPGKHPKFPVFTSVREEAARSLGKQSQSLPEDSGELLERIALLEKAVLDPTLLTGAIDGIALCGLEKKVVREKLSLMLTHRAVTYPELSRIRVIQWYRHAGLRYAGMADDLHHVVASGLVPRVRLSAIHALFVGRRANSSTNATLATLIRGRQLQGEVLQYARALQADALGTTELTHAGPLIDDICRYILGNS